MVLVDLHGSGWGSLSISGSKVRANLFWRFENTGSARPHEFGRGVARAVGDTDP